MCSPINYAEFYENYGIYGIRKKSEKDMWRSDLKELREQYVTYRTKREGLQESAQPVKVVKKKSKKITLKTS